MTTPLLAHLLPGQSTTTIDLIEIRQFLQHGEEVVLGPNGLNLRPLKKAVAMLPNYAQANEDTKNTLEEVFAILFHSQSAIRKRVTEDWFDEHYEAAPGQGIITAIDLSTILGLIPKSQPVIRRR